MYRTFTYQHINRILEYLRDIRGVMPLSHHHYDFIQGTLNNIVVVRLYTNGGKMDYIIDMSDYFKWSKIKDRRLKINLLKSKMI